MQVVLAIVVALVQMAGPWLCCCGPSRLFAPTLPIRAGSEPASICSHCSPTGPDVTTSAHVPGQRSSYPRDPVPSDCPCADHAYQQAPAVVSESDLGLRPYGETQVVEFVTTAELLPPCLPADIGVIASLSDLPFLSTAHRLFVHHALRC